MKSSSTQTEKNVHENILSETNANIDMKLDPQLQDEHRMVVGSSAMIFGRTYQASSILALAAKPRDSVSEASLIISKTKGSLLNETLTRKADLFYENELVKAACADEIISEPNTPVKINNLPLCC